MAKAKLLFDLMMYVNSQQAFTAQEVADEFRVSVRTAHRYLLELSGLGVPVYTEPGRNGGYRVLKNKLLPPISFDEEEAFAIFFAFQSLKYYPSLPFDIQVESASRKLAAGLPEATKHKIERLKSALSFWVQPRNVVSPFLKEIIEAAVEDHRVTIEYQSRSKNTVKEVKPVGVYARDGFWYMPAFDLAAGKVLVFRVDRVVSFADTQKVFQVPTDLETWLTDQEVRAPVRAPVRLRVTLTREGVRQCRGEPWLEPLAETGDGEGLIDVAIDRTEIPFVADYFFRLGSEARVVEPQEIIDRIRQRASGLLGHYAET